MALSSTWGVFSVAFVTLLMWATSGWAEIIQQQRADGRLYFTNIMDPPSHTARRPTSPMPAATSHAAPAGRLLALMHRLAQQHRVDPRLLQAIIRVESNFNPYAVSPAGAQGLMQLMPATAARYQVDKPFDPQANMEGGIRYLKDLLGIFAGELRYVLAAYNAGEDAVYKYGGIPPYPETQRYVERVLALYRVSLLGKVVYRYYTSTGSLLLTDTPR